MLATGCDRNGAKTLPPRTWDNSIVPDHLQRFKVPLHGAPCAGRTLPRRRWRVCPASERATAVGVDQLRAARRWAMELLVESRSRTLPATNAWTYTPGRTAAVTGKAALVAALRTPCATNRFRRPPPKTTRHHRRTFGTPAKPHQNARGGRAGSLPVCRKPG